MASLNVKNLKARCWRKHRCRRLRAKVVLSIHYFSLEFYQLQKHRKALEPPAESWRILIMIGSLDSKSCFYSVKYPNFQLALFHLAISHLRHLLQYGYRLVLTWFMETYDRVLDCSTLIQAFRNLYSKRRLAPRKVLAPYLWHSHRDESRHTEQTFKLRL